jgi:DNA end-binding protein Ku
MARALWTGSISFGLVNVPVALFSGVRDMDLHFRQLHEPDGAPVETRRFCSEEDAEVAFEDVAHGYELDDGRHVVLTDEELAAVEPRKTRTIDVHAFVELAEVDPIYFDHPYLLAPVGESEGTLRAYQLLVDVLGRSGRAALGRFVLRTKEYLVLVRVRDGVLALTTMLFHDEVRDAKGIAPGGAKPKKAEVDEAVALVEALAEDWDPSAFRDCYRERLQAVVERKKKGERITPAEDTAQPSPAVDLMAALQRSLEAATKGGPPRRPASDLESLSRDELYERAQEAGIEGRSKMSKKELAEALRG